MRTLCGTFLGLPAEEGTRTSTAPHLREKGLFGAPVAHFGVVETAGRLALHIHLIFWGGLSPQLLQDCGVYAKIVEEIHAALATQITTSAPPWAHVQDIMRRALRVAAVHVAQAQVEPHTAVASAEKLILAITAYKEGMQRVVVEVGAAALRRALDEGKEGAVAVEVARQAMEDAWAAATDERLERDHVYILQMLKAAAEAEAAGVAPPASAEAAVAAAAAALTAATAAAAAAVVAGSGNPDASAKAAKEAAAAAAVEAAAADSMRALLASKKGMEFWTRRGCIAALACNIHDHKPTCHKGPAGECACRLCQPAGHNLVRRPARAAEDAVAGGAAAAAGDAAGGGAASQDVAMEDAAEDGAAGRDTATKIAEPQEPALAPVLVLWLAKRETRIVGDKVEPVEHAAGSWVDAAGKGGWACPHCSASSKRSQDLVEEAVDVFTTAEEAGQHATPDPWEPSELAPLRPRSTCAVVYEQHKPTVALKGGVQPVPEGKQAEAAEGGAGRMTDEEVLERIEAVLHAVEWEHPQFCEFYPALAPKIRALLRGENPAAARRALALLAGLACRNGSLVSYNDVLTNAFGCNTAPMTLGSLESAKAAMFYLVKYLTKDAVALRACLSVLADAAKHIAMFPSTAEDSGEPPRTGKHFLQRSINALSALQEISDTQAAACLLGGKPTVCSHDSLYAYVWSAVDYTRRLRGGAPEEDEEDPEEGGGSEGGGGPGEEGEGGEDGGGDEDEGEGGGEGGGEGAGAGGTAGSGGTPSQGGDRDWLSQAAGGGEPDDVADRAGGAGGRRARPQAAHSCWRAPARGVAGARGPSSTLGLTWRLARASAAGAAARRAAPPSTPPPRASWWASARRLTTRSGGTR